MMTEEEELKKEEKQGKEAKEKAENIVEFGYLWEKNLWEKKLYEEEILRDPE